MFYISPFNSPFRKGDKVWGEPLCKGTRVGKTPCIRGTRYGVPLAKRQLSLASLFKAQLSLAALFKGRWRGRMARRWVIWVNVHRSCLPCEREDGRTNIYESARVGYI